MGFWQLFKAITHGITQNSQRGSHIELPKLSNILKMCQTKQFKAHIQTKLLLRSQYPQISNSLLIKKLATLFYGYIGLLILFTILSMLAFVGQPFLNTHIKNIISNKFDIQISQLLLQIVPIFLTYKIITSFLFVISDYLFMILGVKVYSTMVKQLIAFKHCKEVDCNLITCIEDDCERLINLPTSCFNSILKIAQFVIFSSMLISKLPSNQKTIAATYWIFLIVSTVMAVYSSKLNLKIMSCKQKRINFEQSTHYILQERRKQLKNIKFLMIIDGIGLILPWVLDVGLMVIIYGIVGMDQQSKYYVLIIFGLIRSSIVGLGTNLNIFAQAWSSLTRISNYLNNVATKKTENDSQSVIIAENELHFTKKSTKPDSKYMIQGKNTKLSQTLKVVEQSTPYARILFCFLISIVFSSNFMYSYCAKSIVSGQSIFQKFNIASLVFQLISLITLYWFVCKCNLGISKSVYNRLLCENHINIQQFTAEDVNRLTGDIRLLDRQLYLAIYGIISRATSIYSSFLYSAISLNNIVVSSLFLAFVIAISVCLIFIFNKFMVLRKESYRKQAVNKGMMLDKLVTHQNENAKWMKIFSYKYFGFAVQITFILIFFLAMILLSLVIIVAIIFTQVPADTSAILIMLISQLDNQFLSFLIQIIFLQLITTAISRCTSVLSFKPK